MAAEQPLTFGALLRSYREGAGLSQEDLAERAGLTASAIGALERGERQRPFPHTVQLLARALGLDDERRAALIAAIPSRAAGRAPGPTSAAPAASAEQRRAQALTPPILAATPAVPPAPGSRAASFVGRREELVALRARLAAACAGQGGIVMLVGEAGIGKTRLAREFADEALAQGVVVLWGCCFEGDWQPPYGPWVEALSAYVHARPAESVRQALGSGAASIAQLVPAVRAALPEVAVPSPLSPDEERFRLYDALIRFLLAVSASQPVLVVIDDLHWADADSLRLLRHLARFVRQAKVLLVGAYRDPEFGLNDEHPLMGTLSVLRRESDYERLIIHGFNRDEVAEYLAQTSGLELPQALVRMIEEETSGNPFYACEVFRHLTEEAKVLQRGGRWSTDMSIRELGIPEGVRQVVGRRVARLSEETRELLRLAAGFSGGFGFEVLQALSGLAERSLLDGLDEALQAGLIRASSRVPPRYEFAHAIVRHTLYDSLNPDRRARLHRRIAIALEGLRTGAQGEDAAELAWQYYASAGLPGAGKGVGYALRAAEQARAAYAHERAAGFLRMARDLAVESSAQERADILCKLALAEAEAVRLEDAQQSVLAALDAMSSAGAPPRARAEFLAVVLRALKDGGADAAVWEPLVERGLALAGGARDLLWARLALLPDHYEVIESGPLGGARWLGSDRDAVAVARAEGDEEDYARTLEPLDWRTREETGAVLALARTWSRPFAVMSALDVAGRDLVYRFGAFHEARGVYEELLAASERFGSIPIQCQALAHLTAARIATGELLLARETLQRAREMLAQLGAGHRLRFASANLAVWLAYFLDGDWPALAAAIVAYASAPSAKRSPAGTIAAASATISTFFAGNVPEARRLLQHVTAIADRPAPPDYCHSTWLSATVCAVWHMEAVEYAATYRRLVLDLLRNGTGDAIGGPLELSVARMALLLGDFAEAHEYFERARSKAAARGHTHMCAIIDNDQALGLMREGTAKCERIAALLDAALAGFQAHGMLAWAARAAQHKQALAAVASSPVPLRHAYPAGLTAREAEVLRLLAGGLSNKDIAARLLLSLATVERHVANIYAKIGAARRYEAVTFAMSHGLGPDTREPSPDA